MCVDACVEHLIIEEIPLGTHKKKESVSLSIYICFSHCPLFFSSSFGHPTARGIKCVWSIWREREREEKPFFRSSLVVHLAIVVIRSVGDHCIVFCVY